MSSLSNSGLPANPSSASPVYCVLSMLACSESSSSIFSSVECKHDGVTSWGPVSCLKSQQGIGQACWPPWHAKVKADEGHVEQWFSAPGQLQLVPVQVASLVAVLLWEHPVWHQHAQQPNPDPNAPPKHEGEA